MISAISSTVMDCSIDRHNHQDGDAGDGVQHVGGGADDGIEDAAEVASQQAQHQPDA